MKRKHLRSGCCKTINDRIEEIRDLKLQYFLSMEKAEQSWAWANESTQQQPGMEFIRRRACFSSSLSTYCTSSWLFELGHVDGRLPVQVLQRPIHGRLGQQCQQLLTPQERGVVQRGVLSNSFYDIFFHTITRQHRRSLIEETKILNA
jgi:hypothetical protein